jgi:hypothetical protein
LNCSSTSSSIGLGRSWYGVTDGGGIKEGGRYSRLKMLLLCSIWIDDVRKEDVQIEVVWMNNVQIDVVIIENNKIKYVLIHCY